MPLRRSTLLAAAFAALLVISAVAALAVWRNTRTAQAEAASLYQQEFAVQTALADLRSGVYLSAILVRDLLLEPGDPADRNTQFEEIGVRIRRGLSVLNEVLKTSDARLSLARLTSELESYNKSTEDILKLSRADQAQRRSDILRARTDVRREILQLTEIIETVARQNSEQERGVMEAGNAAFRSSLAWIVGIGLFLGAGVTALAWTRMASLEAASEAAQSDLRSLSGQLRTAQEQERKYLSRELHDQVGQMLTGLRLELTALGKAAVNPEVQRSVDRAKSTVEQTLGLIRNIAMLLRPSMLDDLGLTPALSWLVKETSRTSGIEIRKEIDDRVDLLPDAHRTCLYRVVQEALTNASRHSGARSLELKMTADDGWVNVLVKDDGRGFEIGKKSS